MQYRSLGRTGTRVSELCLGCMMFGGRTDEAASFDVIDRAVDSGINFIDTANVYSRGASEEVVGKALNRNGKRGSVVLATKVHGRMDDKDPNAAGNHRRHVIEQYALPSAFPANLGEGYRIGFGRPPFHVLHYQLGAPGHRVALALGLLKGR